MMTNPNPAASARYSQELPMDTVVKFFVAAILEQRRKDLEKLKRLSPEELNILWGIKRCSWRPNSPKAHRP
jgi:hypothetical protein